MAELWYPLATKHLLDSEHSRSGHIEDKNSITLHITEGSTASGAIDGWEARHGKDATSAHLIIDRDQYATITQCVPLSDIAWHARQANAHAIGIEHVALSQAGADYYNRMYNKQIVAGKQKLFTYLPVTDAQYQASAKLIAWLCVKLGLLCDRNHIRTHNEASPIDGHVQCCTGALDPDQLVNLARTFISSVSV